MDAILGSGAPPDDSGKAELVRLTGVHKRYGDGVGTVHALHDVNLQVAAGEMVAVCGASGHGKTTLLNLVGMLEPASEGSVVIVNLLTSRLSEQARADLRAEIIGFVFESFTLIPVLTALENVLLPLTLRGHTDSARLKQAQALGNELLARVGLTTQAHHYPSHLDASQRQRVAIARALVTRPRLVLADEPTARLDNGCIRLVMDLFANQQREHGTAFLISTRDQRQLSRVNRTLQLHDGRISSMPADLARKALRVQV